MLEDLGWIGKLPNYSDFIQSGNFISVQRSLMSWLTRGQDHIGEQFFKLNNSESNVYIYYFFVESSISDHKRIHGLFFSSRDSRGRNCPFIIFSHNHTASAAQILPKLNEKLQELGFNWDMLSSNLDNNFIDSIFTKLSEVDSEVGFIENYDTWYELYPKFCDLNFKVETTNHVLFRKLLIR